MKGLSDPSYATMLRIFSSEVPRSGRPPPPRLPLLAAVERTRHGVEYWRSMQQGESLRPYGRLKLARTERLLREHDRLSGQRWHTHDRTQYHHGVVVWTPMRPRDVRRLRQVRRLLARIDRKEFA